MKYYKIYIIIFVVLNYISLIIGNINIIIPKANILEFENINMLKMTSNHMQMPKTSEHSYHMEVYNVIRPCKYPEIKPYRFPGEQEIDTTTIYFAPVVIENIIMLYNTDNYRTYGYCLGNLRYISEDDIKLKYTMNFESNGYIKYWDLF